MSPRLDVSMTTEQIAAFLQPARNAVLSTLLADGSPHAAAMWFAPETDEVLMWTYAKSQKGINLRRDPRCAFMVDEGAAYDELRGVLVTGRARLIEDYDAIVAIGTALYERYTQPALGIPVNEGPLAEIERQAKKRVGLALPLENVASWDHSKLG